MTSERWVRSQRASVVEVGDAVVLVGRDGRTSRLDGDSAELARVVVAFLGRPRSEAEVLAHVEALAGEPLGARAGVVRQLLGVLAQTGSIGEPAAEEHASSRRPLDIVVGVCGAIAASHAPALVTALQRRGHTLEVALTPTATRFVALDVIAAIAQREPVTSMWPRAAHVPVPHVALAEWAELVVIYPATATTIARLARGEFSEVVAAIALTTRAPVVVVPSMNPEMLAAPAVQRNLEQLRADGFAIIHGVPSQEVADAPEVRTALAGAAPSPGEVAATLDALISGGLLRGRDGEPPDASRWQAVYRAAAAGSRALLPWVSETCDADIARALEEYAPPHARPHAPPHAKPHAPPHAKPHAPPPVLPPPPRRLLDIGTGLGQIARRAASAGYRVVATDIAETALELAREATGQLDILWLRDDICATSLVGPFDVLVDRASFHVLPPARAAAWAASVRRITAIGSVVIVKAHRDGVPGATYATSAVRLAALLPDFELVSERAAELPGLVDATPIASTLFVLVRRR